MSIITRAAVVDNAGQNPALHEVELVDPGPGEVRVRVVATSVCHTDVAWADGELWPRYPVVPGHESAGIVEAVGPGVSRVRPGDRVAIALSLHCGHCRYCESGRPMLCEHHEDETSRISRDGEPVIQGFGSGGFSEQTVIRASSAVAIPDDVPMDVAAIVGCATSTGLGAVFNIANVEYGSRVAVLGAGGIGLSVVLGCTLAGVEQIVVADPNEQRRMQALDFGATDVADATEDALRELAPGGFEYVFETAGFPEPMELAIRMTERGGTATIIGAARPDADITINALDFVPSQRRILGCLTGNVRPNVDFDRYFRLYARGKLPLDKFISHHVRFEDIAVGFDNNRKKIGIRTVVDISEE